MSRQVAVIVLVDVAAALSGRTLEGSIHLLDNAAAQGSTGEGGPDLATAVNGGHWMDGSQADEQVVDWALYSLGSIPPTVPRGYRAAERGRGARIEAGGEPGSRAAGAAGGRTPGKAIAAVADVTGALHTQDPGRFPSGHAHPAPVLAAITGEAVDRGILHPAAYGSPDLVTDGWYWSAAVDTPRPGTYGYTLRIELHEPVESGGRCWWRPVRLAHDAAIRVRTGAKRNAFAKAGVGPLPIAACAPAGGRR